MTLEEIENNNEYPKASDIFISIILTFKETFNSNTTYYYLGIRTKGEKF